MSLLSEFAEIAATDGRAALVTVISGRGIGAKLLATVAVGSLVTER